MNTSKQLKEKIKRGEVTVGSWLTIPSPEIAEVMAGLDFDWLTIDLEHSVIDFSTAQAMIRAIDLTGKAPLVRVGVNDPTIIKRVMDAGAHGVIVPMVNSAAEAEAAVSAVKYSPKGTRGVGLGRAQGYGTAFEKYKGWVNEGSVVIVQIEHIQAVKNIEEILSVEGVDGFMVGPYDLSSSLGVPGEFQHPEVLKAMDKIRSAFDKSKALPGFHVIAPDPNQVFDKIREGFRFIAYSLDTLLLAETCKAGLMKIHSFHR
ncbi:MAG: aldolase/citrate lyase family protein [Deltaproteobacteria bacterium]|nr:aldolase/citrate lyase family protein [Deltaproteobacteria bacterium]